MEIALIISIIGVACSLIIAANNFFGLKDRLRNYARRKLEVPTEAEKLKHRKLESDRTLFNRIRGMLPSEYPMMIMREHSFGDSFRDGLTSPMHKFLWESRKPEFEFHDPELEKIRTRLEKHLDRFTDIISTNTWHTEGSTKFRRVPKEWHHKQPDRWREVVSELNDLADEIVEAYDDLIRTGRKKLGE